MPVHILVLQETCREAAVINQLWCQHQDGWQVCFSKFPSLCSEMRLSLQSSYSFPANVIIAQSCMCQFFHHSTGILHNYLIILFTVCLIMIIMFLLACINMIFRCYHCYQVQHAAMSVFLLHPCSSFLNLSSTQSSTVGLALVPNLSPNLLKLANKTMRLLQTNTYMILTFVHIT